MVHESNIRGQRALTRRSPYNLPHASDLSMPSPARLYPKEVTNVSPGVSAQDEIGVTPIRSNGETYGGVGILTLELEFEMNKTLASRRGHLVAAVVIVVVDIQISPSELFRILQCLHQTQKSHHERFQVLEPRLLAYGRRDKRSG